MRAAQSDVYIDKHGRRYRQMSFEQRTKLRKKYRSNVPGWRHPAIGYIVAVPLIGFVTIGNWYLSKILGQNVFPSSTFVVVILFIALLWGVGPSLLAIAAGCLSLDYFNIKPHGIIGFDNVQQIAQLAPFVVSGLIIALITAQREHARLQALATEQELQSYAEELEATNRQLQDANHAKDHFLSIASHELKTPVTTIRGQAQLTLKRIARHKDTSPEMESVGTTLEKINDQTGRLTNLIDELLDISSIRNGKATLHKHLYDLGILTREVVEDQRLLTSRQIILDLPQEPIKMQVDGDRISQVLVNLIGNAIKYSLDRTPIEVKLKAEQNVAQLSIRDHGKGIAKDQLDHIFETFYRTPDAQSSSKRGLGLGLSIAKDIVERHNGRIWCESVVGDGSTFFVELPLEGEMVAEGKEE